MSVQQPAYWAVPSGSNPAGTVTVSYAGATGPQVQNQAQVQVIRHEYNYYNLLFAKYYSKINSHSFSCTCTSAPVEEGLYCKPKYRANSDQSAVCILHFRYFTDPGLQEIRHHSSVCRCGIANFNCIYTCIALKLPSYHLSPVKYTS